MSDEPEAPEEEAEPEAPPAEEPEGQERPAPPNVSVEFEGTEGELTDEQQQQAREAEARLEAVWVACRELIDSLSMPELVETDHPLIPISLDIAPETEERQIILEYVREELLDVTALIPMIRLLQDESETAEGERKETILRLRRFLLAPDNDPEASMGRLAVVGAAWSRALMEYQHYWFEDEADPALRATLARFVHDGNEADAQALIEAGRAGVRAIATDLEADWNEIADHYAALDERGVDPLVATMGLLGRMPSNASAFLLCDYLVSVNHPAVEKAAKAALVAMPEIAERTAMLSIEFEPSGFASRFVLYELLEALKAERLAHRAALELCDDLLNEGNLLEPDDREDMVELFCRNARPQHACVAMRMLQLDLTEDSVKAIESYLESSPDQERVEALRTRKNEGQPLMWLTPDEMENDLARLASQWGVENDDEKLGVVAENTATPFHRFFTPVEVHPGPGAKEAFLDKICQHEVTERLQQIAPQLPEHIDPREIQPMLVAEWWMAPRTETGWKPPIVSSYEEQAAALPDDESLRREMLGPRYKSHAITALLELDHPEAEVERAQAHLDIASRYLDDDDALVAYVTERIALAKPKQKGGGIWTPGGGGGGGAPAAPIIRPGGDKVGRNDPCPCGSGKKYKKCCMS